MEPRSAPRKRGAQEGDDDAAQLERPQLLQVWQHAWRFCVQADGSMAKIEDLTLSPTHAQVAANQPQRKRRPTQAVRQAPAVERAAQLPGPEITLHLHPGPAPGVWGPT
jgi:hypothetical protein